MDGTDVMFDVDESGKREDWYNIYMGQSTSYVTTPTDSDYTGVTRRAF